MVQVRQSFLLYIRLFTCDLCDALRHGVSSFLCLACFCRCKALLGYLRFGSRQFLNDYLEQDLLPSATVPDVDMFTLFMELGITCHGN